MKISLLALLASIAFVQCAYDEAEQPQVNTCSTPATIRDLTNLGGCGFIFELQDGSRLEPLIVFGCGTPPLPNNPENPLSNFNMVDGKKVFINYDAVPDMASACMVGPIVKITCITEASIPREDK